MRLFQCQNCHAPLFFENTTCLSCGYALGYHSEQENLLPLQAQDGYWKPLSDDHQLYHYCANFQHGVCNWLVPVPANRKYCEACALNRTIPNLNSAANRLAWQQLEKAKHRLIYELKQLKLPLQSKVENPAWGLAFDFLSPEDATEEDGAVQTGHQNGLITINLAEADSVHREWIKKKMSEQYRTLIGHFRHEVGHYYWEILVNKQADIRNRFREIFGDERADYSQALDTYYQTQAPSNWQQNYITKYATAHPWEDWAETWSHYLHIMDAVETCYYFGLDIHPKIETNIFLESKATVNPYRETDFEKILNTFVPITFALNSFNRGMGISDVYPFVITTAIKQKLSFIHQLTSAGFA